MSDKENFHVVCRCRPFSVKEKDAGFYKCVKIDSQAGSISLQGPKSDQDAKSFTFDAIFDDDSTQVNICNYRRLLLLTARMK